MLHKNIELRDSPIAGKGLFAIGPIAAGEPTWWETEEKFQTQKMSRAYIQSLPEEKLKVLKHYMYQVDDDAWISAENFDPDTDASNYMNHCCDANTWFVTDTLMVAKRDISPGEEITMDYGTSFSDPDWKLEGCLCGKALCRGTVTGSDYLKPSVQELYEYVHFCPYVARKIAALREKSSL